MKKYILFVLLLGWISAVAAPADTLPGKMNGRMCPEFTYSDVTGKPVSLKDFRGKYVLIDMWGSWCVPCQRELPFLAVLEEEFVGDRIAFVSIAHEHKGDKSGAKWKAQVERDRLGGVQLLASDKEFAGAIGLSAFPTFLLIAPDGRILSSDFYRPSDPQCRNVLLELLRGEKGCDMTQPLRLSDHIRKGVLPNGLSWYVAAATEPKGRASFYLVRNAGAVLESDSQNGLAHFLEHMSFNGTEHFPGQAIKEMLARHGVTGLNAYTSYDETVYYIEGVPTDDRALVDSCLLILHDWCASVLLDSAGIEAERGVIAEEWRTRRTPECRVRRQYAPVLYGERSEYARRDVIGSLDVIRGFRPEELRRFYRDWYRPDLTAVVVAGDFDAEEMEARIGRLFAGIPAVAKPQKRPAAGIELPRQERFVAVTDPEATSSTVTIYRKGWKEPHAGEWTYADLRKSLVEQLTNRMLALRAGEAGRRPDAPVLRYALSYSDLERRYVCYTLSVSPKRQADEKAAYRELLRLQEQALRYGFGKSELWQVKEQLLRSLEESEPRLDQLPAGALINSMKAHFLTGAPLTDARAYQEAIREILPTISVADVWAALKYWTMMSAPVIVVTGPAGGDHLNREDALEMLHAVHKEEIASRTDVVEGRLLLDTAQLKGVPVVKEDRLEKMKAVEWTLANGARVVFRHEELDPGDVSFYAVSPGGMSLYDTDMLPAVREGINFTQKRFGVAGMDAAALARANAGRVALIQFGVSELYETVNGATNPRDLEHTLQLLYLYFTQPRFDAAALADILAMNRASLPVRRNNPAALIADSLKHILAGYSPRALTLDEDYLGRLTIERIEKAFRERFSNAADFTFFFAGNISEAEMKRLAEKYIGSIPGEGRREQWKDRGVRPLPGQVLKTVTLLMQVPKATVVLEYHKEMKYTPENALKHRILGMILSDRLTAVVREREGGTYAIGMNAQSGDEPYDYYRLSSRFDCDPQRAGELRQLIHAETDRLLREGVTESELKNAVAALCSGKESERHPVFHIQVLMNLLEYRKTGIDPLDPAHFEVLLKALTPGDIRSFVRKMLGKADLTEVVFVPREAPAVARFHTLPADLPAEQLLPALAEKFPGQMILVDTWGTWCGSCFSAMEEMKPLKEEWKRQGKNYIFAYLADESSPLEKWKEVAAKIPGEHFRLTKAQFDCLREMYRIPGAPGFLIVDRQGKVVWHSVSGFPGVETMRKVMTEHIK